MLAKSQQAPRLRWNCPYNQPKRTMKDVPFENGGQIVGGKGFRCLSQFWDGVFHSKLLIIAALVGGLLWVPGAFAGVIFSTSSGGNFNAGTSWNGSVPGPADDVFIKAGASITVTANANIHSLTFTNNSTSTATITVNSG